MTRTLLIPSLLFLGCSGDSGEDSGSSVPAYENPCGYTAGSGVSIVEGLSFTADYPDSGIDIGFMGRACVEPDAGWAGHLIYFQRTMLEDDTPVYLTASVWEIESTTAASDCPDCAFAFETAEATTLARVGDDAWNTTEFTLEGIGIGSVDDESPLIHYKQEGQSYANISALGEYTLGGSITDGGGHYDYTFDQYALYY